MCIRDRDSTIVGYITLVLLHLGCIVSCVESDGVVTGFRSYDVTLSLIHISPHSIKIVKQRNQRYFSTLREKLMWGADQRER